MHAVAAALDMFLSTRPSGLGRSTLCRDGRAPRMGNRHLPCSICLLPADRRGSRQLGRRGAIFTAFTLALTFSFSQSASYAQAEDPKPKIYFEVAELEPARFLRLFSSDDCRVRVRYQPLPERDYEIVFDIAFFDSDLKEIARNSLILKADQDRPLRLYLTQTCARVSKVVLDNFRCVKDALKDQSPMPCHATYAGRTFEQTGATPE